MENTLYFESLDIILKFINMIFLQKLSNIFIFYMEVFVFVCNFVFNINFLFVISLISQSKKLFI